MVVCGVWLLLCPCCCRAPYGAQQLRQRPDRQDAALHTNHASAKVQLLLLTSSFAPSVCATPCHQPPLPNTHRSDAVHPPGPLTYRDLVNVLPMMDETVVLRVTGQQLLAALENGVSMWPKQEGRFPQVRGSVR